MSSIPPERGRRPPGVRFVQTRRNTEVPGQFQKLQASALYCPKCRQATPTREILLLVLPEGDLYDYRCAACGTSTGSRTEKKSSDVQIYRG